MKNSNSLKYWRVVIASTVVIGVMIAFAALFAGVRIARARRLYRGYYTLQNNQLQWTESGRAWWRRRSMFNQLRACYLLGKPLPDWGYVVTLRWFQNAVLSISWDPENDSTVVVYRPDPKRPLPFNEVATRLHVQERQDVLGVHLRQWFGEAPPFWMKLRTVPSKPLQPRKNILTASWVTLPDDSTLTRGIQAEVSVGTETWIVLAFGQSKISATRLQTFVDQLVQPAPKKLLQAVDSEIARLRPSGASNAFEAAQLALAMGQWGTAINTFRQVRREKQQDLKFYKAFGTDMRARGYYGQASYGFAEAVQSSPEDPFAWKNLGDTLMLAKNYSIAVNVYRRLVMLRPHSVDAHLRLAKAYRQARADAQALKTYQETLVLDNRNARAYEGTAAEENVLGQSKQAIQMAVIALKLDPRMAEAYADICVAARQLNRPTDALTACNEAVHLAPKKAAPYVALGDLLFNLHKFPEALQAFKNADALGGPTLTTLTYEGFIDAKIGHLKESAAAFERCVKMAPRDIKLHGLLAQVYVKMGDDAGVLREKQALVALANTNPLVAQPAANKHP